MTINLYDVENLDPSTVHNIGELQAFLVSLGSDRLRDLCMSLVISQLQTEINLQVKTDIHTPEEFWMEAIGRILLLTQQQDASGKFPDKRH